MALNRRLFIPRLLVAAASRILPAAQRADWVREWDAEIWHAEHAGLMSAATLQTRALGAFADASFVLRHERAVGIRLHEVKSSRSASLAVLIVLAAMLAFASHGLQSGRALLFSAEANRIFLLAQPGPFMGRWARVLPAQAAAWTNTSETADLVGRWSASKGSVCVADPAAAALFSEAHMQPDCKAIRLEPHAITGFAGIIGRLRAGSTDAGVEAELAAMAKSGTGSPRPAVIPIAQLRKAPLLPVGGTLVLLALFSVLGLRNCSLEAWGWGLSRIGLSFGMVAGSWLELAARAPFTETGSIPGVWTVGLYLFPLTAATIIALWLRRDVRRRCRTCYRSLSMPVFVGFSGRCLFDSGGVESLCTAHHGALLDGSVPGQIATEEWSRWPNTCV